MTRNRNRFGLVARGGHRVDLTTLREWMKTRKTKAKAAPSSVAQPTTAESVKYAEDEPPSARAAVFHYMRTHKQAPEQQIVSDLRTVHPHLSLREIVDELNTPPSYRPATIGGQFGYIFVGDED